MCVVHAHIIYIIFLSPRKRAAERYMVMSAKLVAPTVEANFEQGFDWVIEMIRASPHAEIASELEIAKAIHHLKCKHFGRVS